MLLPYITCELELYESGINVSLAHTTRVTHTIDDSSNSPANHQRILMAHLLAAARLKTSTV